MELLEKAVTLVRDLVTGESPVAVVLGLLCLYLHYQARMWRRIARDWAVKNDGLHERIEDYLEFGWRAQLAKGQKRREPVPADARAEARNK